MNIERTTIGSFPRCDYHLEKAIKNVIDIQLKYDIGIITDGEQRGHMIKYFEQIPGLRRTKRGLKIVRRIKPMKNPDNFYKISDYKKAKTYLASIGREDVKIKIPFAGPITLGFESAYEGLTYYKNIMDRKIYTDLSDALLPIAKRALDIGAYIQIDEPGISACYTSPKFAKEVINDFVSSLPNSAIDEERVSIHVCGPIRNVVYKEILDMEIDVLSLAFSGDMERKNINLISRKSLEDNQKRLGVGFISNTVIEDERIALGRLNKLAEIVGVENIVYIHPDCGFADTPYEAMIPILENMKKASDAFMRSL